MRVGRPNDRGGGCAWGTRAGVGAVWQACRARFRRWREEGCNPGAASQRGAALKETIHEHNQKYTYKKEEVSKLFILFRRRATAVVTPTYVLVLLAAKPFSAAPHGAFFLPRVCVQAVSGEYRRENRR